MLSGLRRSKLLGDPNSVCGVHGATSTTLPIAVGVKHEVALQQSCVYRRQQCHQHHRSLSINMSLGYNCPRDATLVPKPMTLSPCL